MSDYLPVLPILLFSVIVHELAHGYVALRFGDPTARDAGRLTLNPVPHLDLFGSIIVPALSLLAAGRISRSRRSMDRISSSRSCRRGRRWRTRAWGSPASSP
jgi:hypothetical protein